MLLQVQVELDPAADGLAAHAAAGRKPKDQKLK
jgi:hypothetical protein